LGPRNKGHKTRGAPELYSKPLKEPLITTKGKEPQEILGSNSPTNGFSQNAQIASTHGPTLYKRKKGRNITFGPNCPWKLRSNC